MTVAVTALDIVAVVLALHTLANAVLLRRPTRAGAPVTERVSVLIPARDEAARIAPTMRAVLGQQGVPDLEVVVYDDGSRDRTADIVREVGGSRVRLLIGGVLPPGWLGKPHACQSLADAASGSALAFVDADVVLTPDAVAAAVSLLRSARLDLVSPYPRQLTGSWLEHLVQPLLQWSWLTFLPLRLAERSRRPSLAAANGQFLVVDAAAYRRAGGHAAVRGDVLDDVALARAVKVAGGNGGFVDGTAIASCRMYTGSQAVVDGYAKSLWRAFGGPPGAILVALTFLVLYVVPWGLVAVAPLAWPAAVAGPAGRVISAVRTGSRPPAVALLHPLSALVFAVLVVVSVSRHRRRRLTWKGRTLP